MVSFSTSRYVRIRIFFTLILFIAINSKKNNRLWHVKSRWRIEIYDFQRLNNAFKRFCYRCLKKNYLLTLHMQVYSRIKVINFIHWMFTTCMILNRFSNFHLRLHLTSSSFRAHKRYYYKLFSLQEFKQSDLRTSCSSSNYCTHFREKQIKKKQIKNKSLCETLA